MDSEPPVSAEPSQKLRPFQFSLATMFVITAAFAIVLAICFTVPDPWSGGAFLLLICAFPVALFVAIKYGSGTVAVFSTGAIVPTAVCLIGLMLDRRWPMLLDSYHASPAMDRVVQLVDWLREEARIGSNWRPMAVTCWAAGVVIGVVCIGVRQFVQRGRR